MYDKERLFDEKQKLKKLVNQLKDENLRLKTKLQNTESMSKKYDNVFNEDSFMSNNKQK